MKGLTLNEFDKLLLIQQANLNFLIPVMGCLTLVLPKFVVYGIANYIA